MFLEIYFICSWIKHSQSDLGDLKIFQPHPRENEVKKEDKATDKGSDSDSDEPKIFQPHPGENEAEKEGKATDNDDYADLCLRPLCVDCLQIVSALRTPTNSQWRRQKLLKL